MLSNSNTKDQLVYNNLAEIIATSNTVGRRNVYSISGNEQMADQKLGNDAASNSENPNVYSKEDRVNPKEIDSDSAQRIVIMPPTGTDSVLENDIKTIVATLSVVVLIAYVIRKNIKF